MVEPNRPARIRSSLPRTRPKVDPPAQAWRKSTSYRHWRLEVLARDHGQCQFCGARKSLTAHHIVAASVAPDLRYEARNGITLCRSCHRALDRAHGDGLLPTCCAACPFVQIMLITNDQRATGDRRRVKLFYPDPPSG